MDMTDVWLTPTGKRTPTVIDFSKPKMMKWWNPFAGIRSENPRKMKRCRGRLAESRSQLEGEEIIEEKQKRLKDNKDDQEEEAPPTEAEEAPPIEQWPVGPTIKWSVGPPEEWSEEEYDEAELEEQKLRIAKMHPSQRRNLYFQNPDVSSCYMADWD